MQALWKGRAAVPSHAPHPLGFPGFLFPLRGVRFQIFIRHIKNTCWHSVVWCGAVWCGAVCCVCVWVRGSGGLQLMGLGIKCCWPRAVHVGALLAPPPGPSAEGESRWEGAIGALVGPLVLNARGGRQRKRLGIRNSNTRLFQEASWQGWGNGTSRVC